MAGSRTSRDIQTHFVGLCVSVFAEYVRYLILRRVCDYKSASSRVNVSTDQFSLGIVGGIFGTLWLISLTILFFKYREDTAGKKSKK